MEMRFERFWKGPLIGGPTAIQGRVAWVLERAGYDRDPTGRAMMRLRAQGRLTARIALACDGLSDLMDARREMSDNR